MILAPAVADIPIVNVQLSLPKSGDAEGTHPPVVEGDFWQSIATLPGAVTGYIGAALSENTQRSYQGDLQEFLTWGGSLPKILSFRTRPRLCKNAIETLLGKDRPHRTTYKRRAHITEWFEYPYFSCNDASFCVFTQPRP